VPRQVLAGQGLEAGTWRWPERLAPGLLRIRHLVVRGAVAPPAARRAAGPAAPGHAARHPGTQEPP